MRNKFLLFLTLFNFSRLVGQRVSVPLGGNTWGSLRTDGSRAPVDSNGVTGWNDENANYTIWFRVSKPGPIDLSFVAAVPNGSSSLSISISGVRREVDWHGKSM